MRMKRLLLLLCAVVLLSNVPVGARRNRRVCPRGWTTVSGRCFRYVGRPLTWTQAEKSCLSMKGNLASVHSLEDYHRIQHIILQFSHEAKPAWIGGSDAAEEGTWFWTDGTIMSFTSWCPGEPNNGRGKQHCLQMNYSEGKCWDDQSCLNRLPSVCTRKKP